jgi:cytochrome c oxidase subunit 1
MTSNSTSEILARLSGRDRALLVALALGAIVTLAVGVALGMLTALARTGYVPAEPQAGYRMLTSHGVSVFFYWLYFAQIGLLLALAAAQGGRAPRIGLAHIAWAGLALMLVGFAANQAGTWLGAPLLYDGSPDLVGESKGAAGLFYMGYVFLASGLFLMALSAIATTLATKRSGSGASWSTVGFAVAAWSGLVIVSSLATLNSFLPASAWAFGLGPEPANHTTGWHLLFHNLHYLPLMGTVIVWYALLEDMTGAASIFGQRFSKAIFTLYLVFVPPTSLYHMFLDPSLSPMLRGLGSLLSLFISVPTIAVFLVVVTSLEARARADGARGLFGWLKILPWREPAMVAIGVAVVNLALGGVFAFVLIQERLAPLLSDTFFVPAYFHFLTVGTVTLTLLGAYSWILPALSGRKLRARTLLCWLSITATAGLAVFGGSGMTAGLNGMPRRVLDASYDGAAPPLWNAMSAPIALGAAVMGLSLVLYLAVLAASTAGAGSKGQVPGGRRTFNPTNASAARGHASWTAPACIVLLVLAMYGATAFAFALLRALPIAAEAGVAQ